MDQSAIDELAQTFMRARQTGERLDALPAHLKPKNFADSCAVMDAVDKLVGERIVGTKIAAKPGAEVVYAPLPAGRVFTARPACRARSRPANTWNARSASASPAICRRDKTEYSEQEVFDALEACAAFELVDSRFRDLKSAMDNTPYEFYADHIANGAMVFGAFRKRLAEVRLHQDPRVDEAGRQDHHRKDRRPSDRQSGQARGGAGQPPARRRPGSRPARSSSPARSPAFIRSSSTSR